MRDDPFRIDVLRRHGARGAVVDELLAYTLNAFTNETCAVNGPFPLPDEPFVETWTQYIEIARHEGVFNCLRDRLVQLRFPIAHGMGQDAAYRRATRSGVRPRSERMGLGLAQPDALQLRVHTTPAGRIPVLIAGPRQDFVTLVRALTCRNEPKPIPASIGAAMVAGYNNWDRVRALRRAWEADAHAPGNGAEWTLAFRDIATRKELYQDRFIILSSGPYSATSAASVRLSEATWLDRSLRIRLEHECAHYFTRRVFGTMRSSLHDELIADFAGIRAAAGAFRADWQLRFLGLESESYRPGGRLENYRGDPLLSDAAFTVLQHLVRHATANLEGIEQSGAAGAPTVENTARTITTLARLALEELASDQALARFRHVLGAGGGRADGGARATGRDASRPRRRVDIASRPDSEHLDVLAPRAGS